MTLNRAQLEQYRSQGYAIGNRILDSKQLARLRSEIDRLTAELPPGQRPENMPSTHYDNPYLKELFLSGPLVDVAEQILGPNIALFTSYIICKRPGDGLAVDWHQDGAFFPIDPMETFTLWLAVDDVDGENGCMHVIPRSKKLLLPHRVDVHSGTTLPLSLEGVNTANARPIELKAGEFSVHDPFVLHGSSANRSTRRRCGITLKYVPTSVSIDREFVSPTGFDWAGLRLYLARGEAGGHEVWN